MFTSSVAFLVVFTIRAIRMRGPSENKNKLSDLPRAEPIHTNHSNALTRQTSYMQQATGESSVCTQSLSSCFSVLRACKWKEMWWDNIIFWDILGGLSAWDPVSLMIQSISPAQSCLKIAGKTENYLVVAAAALLINELTRQDLSF